MSAVMAPEASQATGRPPCVSCCRPYGRSRTPLLGGDTLLGCEEPLGFGEFVVCDQCWRLAGGRSAVVAALLGHAERDRSPGPPLRFAPDIEALFARARHQDLLHPVDRLLVDSGIRWVVLRHIAVPARIDLAHRVLQRRPLRDTRAADSPDLWMEAVEARIRERSGTEFVYAAKRRRWWLISSVFRHCADRSGRPLAWVTQEEIASAVGCATRTVRRCVAWLRREGLLFEIVPGCQLPQQAVPDGATDEERAIRRRMAATDAD
ncbi:MAG: hypothetical protein ACRDQ0_15840, partial [Pseudonocardia sp.]